MTTPGSAHEQEAERIAGAALDQAGPALPDAAPASVVGDRLPRSLRGQFEDAFRADFTPVRIHADGDAARSARALQARAYTVGSDIWFGAGQYQPATTGGRRLIAHELAHVVQNRRDPGRAAALVARDFYSGVEAELQAEDEVKQGKWNRAYGRDPSQQYGNERGTIGEDVTYTKDKKQYSRRQPELEAASKATAPGGGKGTPMDMSKAVTDADVKDVLTFALRSYIQSQKQDVPADLDARWEANAKGTGASVTEAFRVMQLDTLEAQALYLAHSSVEGNWVANAGSDASARMTAQADPPDVKEFKGRGPVQVTWQQNYVKTLAYLDEQAKHLDAEGKADDAAKARAASAAIKADPAKAADPQYAYIFSGAMMHSSGGVRAAAEMPGRTPTFGGTGPEDRWETGGDNFDERIAYWTGQKAAGNAAADERLAYWNSVKLAGQRKAKAYNRALDVLKKNLLQATPAANQAPASAPAAVSP